MCVSMKNRMDKILRKENSKKLEENMFSSISKTHRLNFPCLCTRNYNYNYLVGYQLPNKSQRVE